VDDKPFEMFPDDTHTIGGVECMRWPFGHTGTTLRGFAGDEYTGVCHLCPASETKSGGCYASKPCPAGPDHVLVPTNLYHALRFRVPLS
jgi:hypothetical protein